MTTLDMMIKAKEDGKTYKSNNLFYNNKLGFVDSDGYKWDASAFEYLNDLLDIDTWEQDTRTYMTKSEAEQKYGIVIMGD